MSFSQKLFCWILQDVRQFVYKDVRTSFMEPSTAAGSYIFVCFSIQIDIVVWVSKTNQVTIWSNKSNSVLQETMYLFSARIKQIQWRCKIKYFLMPWIQFCMKLFVCVVLIKMLMLYKVAENSWLLRHNPLMLDCYRTFKINHDLKAESTVNIPTESVNRGILGDILRDPEFAPGLQLMFRMPNLKDIFPAWFRHQLQRHCEEAVVVFSFTLLKA